MEILFEIFEGHLILIHLDILKTILNLAQRDILLKRAKNSQDVLRRQITLLLPIQAVKQIEQLLLDILLFQSFIEF